MDPQYPQPGVQGPVQPANVGVRPQLPALNMRTPKPLPFGLQGAADSAGSAIMSGLGHVGTLLNNSPLNLRNADPAGRMSGAFSAPKMAASSDTSHLPEWAHTDVVKAGGDPSKYVVNGKNLMSAITPEQISQSVAAAPPHPADAAPVQSVAPVAVVPGVQGAAPVQGRPGISQGPVSATSAQPPVDPMRAQLVSDQRLAAGAARNSHQQFYYPPGTGTDPIWAPNMRNEQAQAATESVNRYDLTQATLAEKDPAKKLAMLREIFSDPKLRDPYILSQGGDAASLAALPRLGQDEGIPEDPRGMQDQSLLGRLRQAKSVQGISDPAHPQHQALQSFVNQRFANPADWNEETYIPPAPGTLNGVPSWLQRPAGMMAAMVQGMGGGDDSGHSAGTGFSWPQNYRDRLEQQQLMKNIGIQAPGSQ